MKPAHYAWVAPGLVLLCAMSSAQSAEKQSAENIRLAFDIPGKRLEESLTEFAQATQLQVLFQSEMVKERRAPRISGLLTAESALQELLADSGLRYEFVNSRTVAIRGVSSHASASAGRQTFAEADHDSSSEGGGSMTLSATPRGVSSASIESDPSNKEAIQQVLIRGSLSLNADIQRTEDDIQPYVVFDRKVIERSGAQNTGDFLRRRLSMAYDGIALNQQTSAVGEGYGASSLISLRGLNFTETLVLVDGRRPAAVSVFGAALQSDVNAIPLGAIERIEVLPTSASGIYGGGATGGVINIVLRRDYEGVNTAVYYDNSFHNDGRVVRVDMTSGLSFRDGATRVLFNGSYSDTDQFLRGDRRFYVDNARRVFDNTGIVASGLPLGGTPNIRSATSVGGVLQPLVLDNGTPLNSPYAYVPYGYAAGDGGAGIVPTAGHYNLDLADSDQVSGSRQSAVANPTSRSVSLTLQQQISTHLSAFVELSASRIDSYMQSSPYNGAFSLAGTAAGNPFRQNITIRIPLVGVEQTYSGESTTARVLTGLLFDLPGSWRGEFDYSWSKGDSDGKQPSLVLNPTLAADIANGTIPVFRDLNLAPIDVRPYLLPDSTSSSDGSSQSDWTVRAGGRLPFALAGEPVTLSLVGEYRDEHQGEFVRRSWTSPTSPQTISRFPTQDQSVMTMYAETNWPVVESSNALPGLKRVDVQLAGRYDKYDQTGSASQSDLITSPHITRHFSATSPTVGLRVQPVEIVTFRASYAEGFLPPQLSQLLSSDPSTIAVTGLRDPQRGGEAITTLRFIGGGNPNLQPEESASWSVGLILTPMEHLRASIDWTRTKKHDNITQIPLNQISINREAELPNLLVRGSPIAEDGFTVGPITGFNQFWLNAFRAKYESYDFSLGYQFAQASFGTWSLHTRGTRLMHRQVQLTVGLPGDETAGVTTTPDWAGNATLEWEFRHLNLELTAQYLDSYWLAVDHSFNVGQQSARVGSKTYFDFAGSYEFAEPVVSALSKTRLSFGIRNLFDTEPRFVAVGLVDPQTSPRLATYYFSINKAF